ncbi:MAG: hypothetical protein AAF654_11005, partial [Myxococcota bacterium]
MGTVQRTWGQWATDIVTAAGQHLEEAADQVADTAHGVAEDAVSLGGAAAESVVGAVDYWESHSAATVTSNFRAALDERVSDTFGDTAGQSARLLSTPITAAARFAVQGAQGV